MVSASWVLQEPFRARTRLPCLVNQCGWVQLGVSAVGVLRHFLWLPSGRHSALCGRAWIGSLRPYTVAGVRQALGARVEQGGDLAEVVGGDPEISKTLDGHRYRGMGSSLSPQGGLLTDSLLFVSCCWTLARSFMG